MTTHNPEQSEREAWQMPLWRAIEEWAVSEVGAAAVAAGDRVDAIVRAALSTKPAEPTLTLAQALACVPGGSLCDPQQVADALCEAVGMPAEPVKRLTNDQLLAALESKLQRGATYCDQDATAFALGVEWAQEHGAAQLAKPSGASQQAPEPVADAVIYEYCTDDKGEVPGECWNSASVGWRTGYLATRKVGERIVEWDAMLAAPQAPAPAATSAEALDAARYRWLRDTGAVFTVRANGIRGDGCDLRAINRPALGLDEAIDAAIAASTKEQP